MTPCASALSYVSWDGRMSGDCSKRKIPNFIVNLLREMDWRMGDAHAIVPQHRRECTPRGTAATAVLPTVMTSCQERLSYIFWRWLLEGQTGILSQASRPAHASAWSESPQQ